MAAVLPWRITLNIEQRARLGFGYLEYLKGRNPEYFVTLTYRHPFGDRIAEEGMRGFVLKLLNRMPRSTRRNFGGLVCAERHTNPKFDGSYHFHFLLWGLDESMPDAHSWLTANVVKAAAELHPRPAGPLCDCAEAIKFNRPKTCKGGLSCRGPQMSGSECVNVQRIEYMPERVHSYTIEDVYRLDMPAGGQLLNIGPQGVTGSLLRKGLL